MSDAAPLTLTGYSLSVYTRSAAMVLHAKGAQYGYVECDPFDPAQSEDLRALHPFGRVPVLRRGDFTLWETAAILAYLDAVLEGPRLTPEDPQTAARMRQVMGIADAYAYRPLVRDTFSHGVFRPLTGEPWKAARRDAGLAAAPRILDALEDIAAEGRVLIPGQLCLGACLLWPMLDYFAMLPQAAALIAARPALHRWAGAMRREPVARATRPVLGDSGEGETS